MKKGRHLTPDEVAAVVRRLRTTTDTRPAVAKAHGISTCTVAVIIRGGHRHHPEPVRRPVAGTRPKGVRLTPATAKQAAQWLADGVAKNIVAQRLGVSWDAIHCLAIGKTWSRVTGIVQGFCW